MRIGVKMLVSFFDIPRLIEESEKFLAFGGLMDSAGV
jgi:hypothetical protein